MSPFASYFGYGAVSALVGAVVYSNLPTRLTIGGAAPTYRYLSEAKLNLLEPGISVMASKEILAKDILSSSSPILVMAVRRPGCMLCREEASSLSDVMTKIKQKDAKLIGIVHETIGVDEFRPYLKDAIIYYDPKKQFYGPAERWLPKWMGFLRLSTYLNSYRAYQKGFKGNSEGEGSLLGGVYLINKENVVFSHLERQWGDKADTKKLLDAFNNI